MGYMDPKNWTATMMELSKTSPAFVGPPDIPNEPQEPDAPAEAGWRPWLQPDSGEEKAPGVWDKTSKALVARAKPKKAEPDSSWGITLEKGPDPEWGLTLESPKGKKAKAKADSGLGLTVSVPEKSQPPAPPLRSGKASGPDSDWGISLDKPNDVIPEDADKDFVKQYNSDVEPTGMDKEGWVRGVKPDGTITKYRPIWPKGMDPSLKPGVDYSPGEERVEMIMSPLGGVKKDWRMSAILGRDDDEKAMWHMDEDVTKRLQGPPQYQGARKGDYPLYEKFTPVDKDKAKEHLQKVKRALEYSADVMTDDEQTLLNFIYNPQYYRAIRSIVKKEHSALDRTDYQELRHAWDEFVDSRQFYRSDAEFKEGGKRPEFKENTKRVSKNVKEWNIQTALE